MLIFHDCIAYVLTTDEYEDGIVTKYFFSRVKNEAQATELLKQKGKVPPGSFVRYGGKSIQVNPISTLWEVFTPSVASLPQSISEGTPQS